MPSPQKCQKRGKIAPNTESSQLDPAGPSSSSSALRAILLETGSPGSVSKDATNRSQLIDSRRRSLRLYSQKVLKQAEQKGPTPQNPSIINHRRSPRPQKIFKQTVNEKAERTRPKTLSERPFLPFMMYNYDMWNQVKAKNLQKKACEVERIIGKMWEESPEDVRNQYNKKYEREMLKWETERKSCNVSPAYVDHTAMSKINYQDRRSRLKSLSIGEPSSAANRTPITIQQPQDKQNRNNGPITRARCARNQRQLIDKRFLNSSVPVMRSVMTTKRLEALMRQAKSSFTYQKKLEGDLQMVEKTFKQKKQEFIGSCKTYNDELKTLCKKVMELEKIERLVQQEMKTLRNGRNRRSVPTTTPVPPKGKPPSSKRKPPQ